MKWVTYRVIKARRYKICHTCINYFNSTELCEDIFKLNNHKPIEADHKDVMNG